MPVIEKFLGQRVEIPEDFRYDHRQGLWGKCTNDSIVFGLTQPALVLSGGVKDIDWLVDETQSVDKGEAILFAITGKILYIEAPVSGAVRFNNELRQEISRIAGEPYGQGWLFSLQPADDLQQAYQALSSAQDYLEKLRLSEGFKNPEGVKGGVSGICKAVYTTIGAQKI